MRRLIFKFIMISLVIFAFVSCKTFTYVNENGIKIMLPKGAQEVEAPKLDNKYSNEFYWVSKSTENIYSWGNNFYLNDNIVFSFDYGILEEDNILDKKGQKDRLNALLYVSKSKFDKMPFYKHMKINENLILLIFYQNNRENNTDDYFVRFETERTKPRVITGLIRFPATMPLEEIEKRTIKILSGVKLKN